MLYVTDAISFIGTRKGPRIMVIALPPKGEVVLGVQTLARQLEYARTTGRKFRV